MIEAMDVFLTALCLAGLVAIFYIIRGIFKEDQ